MKIIIIVARSTEGVIGRNNELPWRLPADLQHFKKHTLGHPIIMGRKTWDSLGRALPERRNIVISRTPNLSLEPAESFSSLEEAITACENSEKVFIIGGANVYQQAIELADEMLITEVQIDVTGDVDPSAAMSKILTSGMITEVMKDEDKKFESLKEFYPNADKNDWRLEIARLDYGEAEKISSKISSCSQPT